MAEYKKLDAELKLATGRMMEQERTIRTMRKECQRKICAVRHFWKDKIYNERTRGGKILKLSMQNHQL